MLQYTQIILIIGLNINKILPDRPSGRTANLPSLVTLPTLEFAPPFAKTAAIYVAQKAPWLYTYKQHRYDNHSPILSYPKYYPS